MVGDIITKRGLLLILLLLFAAFFSLRAFNLDADSPETLSWSLGPYTDEGSKHRHLRSIYLYGVLDISPIEDYSGECIEETPPTIDNPISNTPYLLAISAFGLGFPSIRLVSVIFSMLLLFAFFLMTRRGLGKNLALLSTALLGFNYVFIMYNRLALLEIPMLFFIVLSLYFWLESFHRNSPLFFRALSFLSFLIAFVYKPIALIYLPVLFGGFLLLRTKETTTPSIPSFSKKKILLIVAAAVVALISVIYLSFSILPTFLSHLSYRVSLTPTEIFRTFTIFIINRMFLKLPVIIGLAFIGLLFAAKNFFEIPEKQNRLEFLAAVWFIFGCIAFSLINYQPPRYLIYLIPPATILAVIMLRKIYTLTELAKPFFQNTFSKIAGYLWLLILAFSVSAYINKFVLSYPSLEDMAIAIIAGFFLLSILLVVLSRVLNRVWQQDQKITLPKNFAKYLVIVLLIFSFSFSFLQYSDWLFDLKYSVRDSSADLHQTLSSKDANVLGLWTDTLCFETELTCYSGGSCPNYESVFYDLSVSHLLLSDTEIGIRHLGIYRTYESISLEHLKSYFIRDVNVSLYKVNLTP